MPEQETKVVPTLRAPLLIGQQDAQFQRRAQLNMGFQFFNGLPVSVTVSTRSGARFIIPPIPGAKPAKLVICASVDRKHEVKFDGRDLLDSHGLPVDDEAKFLEEQLANPVQTYPLSPMVPHSGSVKYALSKQDFDRNGGQLYLHNLDLVVSIYALENVSAHPGTIAGQNNKFLNDDPILSKLSGFSFTIEIVDRAKRFGERFINLYGTVYRIPTTDDPFKNDGVYIRRPGESVGQIGGIDIPEAQYITYEDAEKITWLYRTHHEASTLGDPEAQAKRDLDDRKYRFQQQEQAWKEQDHIRKMELSRQTQELEQERERIKRAQQAREDRLNAQETTLRLLEADLQERKLLLGHASDTRKYYSELQSNKHKERMEYVKIIPAGLAVIGAGIALYKQLSK